MIDVNTSNLLDELSPLVMDFCAANYELRFNFRGVEMLQNSGALGFEGYNTFAQLHTT